MKSWNQEKIRRDMLDKAIEWKFNPPAASHRGGVWERLIRSIRRILHSLLGEGLVNEETLRTFFVEVEKILNDRPITPVSSYPDDLAALTPNDILLFRGNPCTGSMEPGSAVCYRTRWKYVQHLANQFYTRWIKEYVSKLQECQKWLKVKPNISVGDLVLVIDKDISRGKWPKALVEETYPDEDGIVRQVRVRTATGTYQRDIRKLCILEEKLLNKLEL